MKSSEFWGVDRLGSVLWMPLVMERGLYNYEYSRESEKGEERLKGRVKRNREMVLKAILHKQRFHEQTTLV